MRALQALLGQLKTKSVKTIILNGSVRRPLDVLWIQTFDKLQYRDVRTAEVAVTKNAWLS